MSFRLLIGLLVGQLTHSDSFVICNEGYTIERYIHGMDAEYNDIGQWKFKELVNVFGADPKESKTVQVKTKQEAEDLFNDQQFSSAPYLQVNLHSYFCSTWLTRTVHRAVHAKGRCSESIEASGSSFG